MVERQALRRREVTLANVTKANVSEGEIELEAWIPAPPDVVYGAWTDARTHAEFTGADASGEARVGARFTAWDGYIISEYRELVDGQRVVQAWSTTDFPDGHPPSNVVVSFFPQRGGTRVVLEHTGLPPAQTESYASGWVEYYLEPLTRWVAGRSNGSSGAKAAAKKGAAKKSAGKTTPVKKSAAKKSAAKKSAAKKGAVRKSAAKKSAAKKGAAKKGVAKKGAAKKTTTKKTGSRTKSPAKKARVGRRKGR